ncbi:DUF2845 domain-containing protein [Legionella longbeachae]|nr:DUF2845 domain-containing protein [Legionella longbeachae]VEE01758.1 Protein of uncharacterised function (DUF2845) [Legionella oakridgensis]HBD7396511.1 DUF2845 domain-containing protein [Legionella pneumophila]ARB91914.1 DUF2845 domain-containing protein [Legionella longbeachae]EEZ95644.1 conserved hypothetical protein [Legionella longbeachae D-4968]QIN31678.1 DUF2845 domain-containing protein [Legionella longbeachae]
MKLTLYRYISLGLFILPFSLFADTQSYYCPQNHGYINLGMTPDQVIAACGQPISQQESNQPVLQKIPMQQLIYNNAGASNAYAGVWQVPGTTPAGSGSAYYNVWSIPQPNSGAQLEVDVVNQKVKYIKLNGSNSNAVSICSGANIQPGDPIQKVYYSCGSPTVTNNTYINEVVPTAQKPQVWIYQPGQYQSAVTMTFVNGKLYSIQ